jgi:hypothetical protein
MKKLIAIMLVATVPFSSMAQKRSKKNKEKEQAPVTAKASVEYMVIKGIEFPISSADIDEMQEEVRGEDVRKMEMKRMLKPHIKLLISYDYGSSNQREAGEMMRYASKHRTMVSAMNAAVEKGWEFMSANVFLNEKTTTHYYYMRRE